jgi:6-pyruvoyl-tetrahydropterin synthase
MNKSDETERKPMHPFDSAGFWSKFSYWLDTNKKIKSEKKVNSNIYRWIIDILKHGLSKPITESDIYECSKNQKSHENMEKFKTIWNDELKQKKPSLVNSVTKFCAMNIFLIGIPISVLELLCK